MSQLIPCTLKYPKIYFSHITIVACPNKNACHALFARICICVLLYVCALACINCVHPLSAQIFVTSARLYVRMLCIYKTPTRRNY